MSENSTANSELDLDDVRKLLETRRSELIGDGALGREAAGTVELDQTRQGRLSRMDALQQQAMAAEAQRRRSQELTRIGAALKRVQEGEYGYCLSCGEDIVPARLRLDPAATQCVACAGKTARDVRV